MTEGVDSDANHLLRGHQYPAPLPRAATRRADAGGAAAPKSIAEATTSK